MKPMHIVFIAMLFMFVIACTPKEEICPAGGCDDTLPPSEVTPPPETTPPETTIPPRN